MLTGGRRVTNGCGDEYIRFVVVNGRFVVVVVVENGDVGDFIVVDAVDFSINASLVVKMTGLDVDFDVIFGM